MWVEIGDSLTWHSQNDHIDKTSVGCPGNSEAVWGLSTAGYLKARDTFGVA